MKINLTQKPKKPTIIIGFPGIGLIGPIVTEFLIEHTKTSLIGKFEYDDLPPTVAIHKSELIHPMSLHYSKTHNALILYTILNIRGKEWEVAKQITKLARDLQAEEIISVDGANTMGEEGQAVFSFGNEDLKSHGAQALKESVITGVTGALLLEDVPLSCLFAATHTQMPDSKASSEVVKILDKYLDLDVDHRPLLEQAKAFEKKLKTVIEQSRQLSEQDKGRLDYLG